MRGTYRLIDQGLNCISINRFTWTLIYYDDLKNSHIVFNFSQQEETATSFRWTEMNVNRSIHWLSITLDTRGKPSALSSRSETPLCWMGKEKNLSLVRLFPPSKILTYIVDFSGLMKPLLRCKIRTFEYNVYQCMNWFARVKMEMINTSENVVDVL